MQDQNWHMMDRAAHSFKGSPQRLFAVVLKGQFHALNQLIIDSSLYAGPELAHDGQGGSEP
jgi:hypothetical protein